eukprot:TRINITY_DN11033_c0_g1_i1.p1 TRINITY_DN11033_c0_g1~~TRINITY_DN11033_c0_g1_i1.p1  ORF type:complete len:243 (+),score=61.86 TRINITY_DN11033_c0_g1_i1:3-731(+)
MTTYHSLCRLPSDVSKYIEKKKRPWVTLTYAQSLDGCISGEIGKSLALSGPESMNLTHQLRATHTAILVGVNTVIVDNPSLTVRCGVTGPNPKPVILDASLRTPLQCKLISSNDCVKPIIVTIDPKGDSTKLEKMEDLKKAGADIIVCRTQENTLDLGHMLELLLSEKKIENVMVEGGASIITSFLNRPSLIDNVILTISPLLVGGVRGVNKLEGIQKLKNPQYHQFGQDFVVQGYLEYSTQ